MVRTLFLFCLTLPLISGCAGSTGFKLATAGLYATSQGIFSDPDVNIKEKSYAAADFLVQDLRNTALRKQMLSTDYDQTFIIHPLVENDNTDISSDFGARVSEWAGRRFSELGYITYMNKVAPDNNTGLYPAPPRGTVPDFIFNGTYSVQHKHVDVMLRIFDARTNDLLANFDYAMPINREIRNMAKTETQIFRVNGDRNGNSSTGAGGGNRSRAVMSEPLK